MTNRELNTYLIKLYTYGVLMIENLNDMDGKIIYPPELRKELENIIKLIESTDTRKLFKDSELSKTLQQKFEFNLNKEFERIKIHLAKK